MENGSRTGDTGGGKGTTIVRVGETRFTIDHSYYCVETRSCKTHVTCGNKFGGWFLKTRVLDAASVELALHAVALKN